MNKEIGLERILGRCECGKCNIPSYSGRLYDKEWSCEEQKYVRSYIFEYEVYLLKHKNTKPLDTQDVQPDYQEKMTYTEFKKLIKSNPHILNRLLDEA